MIMMRRAWTKAFKCRLAIVVCCGWAYVAAPAAPAAAAPDAELMRRAALIHERVLTIDSHVDTPSVMIRSSAFDITERHDVLRHSSQVDLPRMVDGGMDGAFFIVFLPQGPLTDEGYAAARARADLMFDTIDVMLEDHGDSFERALTAADAGPIEDKRKIAIYIGIENGYPLGDDLSLLETYYDRGARYVTLSHFANNQLSDSSTDPNGPRWNGLSPFGETVVAEMNRLGMMVDISHTSDETFWDVIALARAPVIASHSGAFAVYAHPRNMKDDMLVALAANGGVVQINGYSTYLADVVQDPRRVEALQALTDQYGRWWRLPAEEQAEPRRVMAAINEQFPPQRANLSDVADHIDHVVGLIGIDHVGISMDFDGGGGVDGAAQIDEMGNLTLELVRRGYTEQDIGKIWSGNLLRVMADVEKSAGGGAAVR